MFLRSSAINGSSSTTRIERPESARVFIEVPRTEASRLPAVVGGDKIVDTIVGQPNDCAVRRATDAKGRADKEVHGFWMGSLRILDGECTEIGCGVHHGYWKTRE